LVGLVVPLLEFAIYSVWFYSLKFGMYIIIIVVAVIGLFIYLLFAAPQLIFGKKYKSVETMAMNDISSIYEAIQKPLKIAR